MYYKLKVKDFIRVPPDHFGMPVKDAIIKRVKKQYDGFIDQELGIVIDVLDVAEIGEGVVIPGDGASYYDTVFFLMTFRVDMQEVVVGKIRDIADFGAFIGMGPIEGMVHVSQAMDDFVSFSKEKVLLGRDSKRTLRVNDPCRARIIAISFKDVANPKIGLTMRQVGLGKLEWLEEDPKKARESDKEEKTKEEKKEDKKEDKKK